jgi:hypothetical protein
MTAASTSGSPQELLGGGFPARQALFPWAKTVVLDEGMDKRSRGARRGMGRSAYARVAEIISGGAVSQQGLAATCTDLAREGPPERRGGIRSYAWARTSDEREVTLSETTREVVLTWGYTPRGQRSPGHSVATAEGHGKKCPDRIRSNFPSSGNARVDPSSPRLGRRQTTPARGRRAPALELPLRRAGRRSDKCVQSRGRNRTREIRPPGIAGRL